MEIKDESICIKRYFLFFIEEILIVIIIILFYKFYSSHLQFSPNPIQRQDISMKQSIWQYPGCQLISSSIPWLFVIKQSKTEKLIGVYSYIHLKSIEKRFRNEK